MSKRLRKALDAQATATNNLLMAYGLICKCGHVRNEHWDGRLKCFDSCPCTTFTPAQPATEPGPFSPAGLIDDADYTLPATHELFEGEDGQLDLRPITPAPAQQDVPDRCGIEHGGATTCPKCSSTDPRYREFTMSVKPGDVLSVDVAKGTVELDLAAGIEGVLGEHRWERGTPYWGCPCGERCPDPLKGSAHRTRWMRAHQAAAIVEYLHRTGAGNE